VNGTEMEKMEKINRQLYYIDASKIKTDVLSSEIKTLNSP